MLTFSTYQIPVGTTSQRLISIRPKKLHSLLIYGAGDMYIGTGGCTSSSGLKLSSGGSFSLSHADFNVDALKHTDELIIDGVADVATVATIVLISSV